MREQRPRDPDPADHQRRAVCRDGAIAGQPGRAAAEARVVGPPLGTP